MRLACLPLSLAPFLLAACDSAPQPPAAQTEATAEPTATPAPLPTEIPAAFHGRWGLAAADCTSEQGDAKGLLEVSGSELEFYESVGKLEEVTGATNGRFRGKFGFTGEGESWQREIVLDLRSGGEVLVRREFGADASPEPFDYTRCP